MKKTFPKIGEVFLCGFIENGLNLIQETALSDELAANYKRH
jgi:hypothetical protein